MKLTLKQQWRPRPLASFLGFMDIKTGVTLGLIFALLNKVAGVYGLVALFTGASFAQLSLYVYSTVALVAFAWGLKAVSEEDPRRTLYFAHLFFADHVLSTAWTAFFAVVWWIYTPHDGRRIANSAAQVELMKGGAGHNMTDEERSLAAMTIWNKEKGTAATVIAVGWLIKIYFAILVYSYAIHLRKGSYRSLPYSNSFPTSSSSQSNGHYTSVRNSPSQYSQFPDSVLGDADDDEYDEHSLYRMPSSSGTKDAINISKPSPSGSSITSFADFVSAPGRGRRYRNNGPINNASSSAAGTPKSAFFPHTPSRLGDSHPRVNDDDADEVLFDSDEMGALSHSSKPGTTTEESTSEDGDTGREREASSGSASGRRTPAMDGTGRSYAKGR